MNVVNLTETSFCRRYNLCLIIWTDSRICYLCTTESSVSSTNCIGIIYSVNPVLFICESHARILAYITHYL